MSSASPDSPAVAENVEASADDVEYEAVKTQTVMLSSAAQGWRAFPDMLFMSGDGEFQKSVRRALPDIATGLTTLDTDAQILEIMNGEDVAALVVDFRTPRSDHMYILAQLAQAYPGAPCIIITPSDKNEKGQVRLASAFGEQEESIRLPERNISHSLGHETLTAGDAKRAAPVPPQQGDTGFMKGISVGGFVEFLDLEGKTCTLSVVEPGTGRTGSLNFRHGRIHDALTETRDGLDAALEILAWRRADISISDFCPDIPDRIKMRTQNLLMLAAQKMDEQGESAE